MYTKDLVIWFGSCSGCFASSLALVLGFGIVLCDVRASQFLARYIVEYLYYVLSVSYVQFSFVLYIFPCVSEVKPTRRQIYNAESSPILNVQYTYEEAE